MAFETRFRNGLDRSGNEKNMALNATNDGQGADRPTAWLQGKCMAVLMPVRDVEDAVPYNRKKVRAE